MGLTLMKVDLAPATADLVASAGEAGFFIGREESKNMFYRLADGRITGFISLTHRMFCEVPQAHRQGVKR